MKGYIFGWKKKVNGPILMKVCDIITAVLRSRWSQGSGQLLHLAICRSVGKPAQGVGSERNGAGRGISKKMSGQGGVGGRQNGAFCSAQ